MTDKVIGNIKIINEELTIHSTPLEEIIMKDNSLFVYFDDYDEKRWCFSTPVVQAVKVTTVDLQYGTIDYFNGDFERRIEEEYTTNFEEIDKGIKKPIGYAYRQIFEIGSSPWIRELKTKNKNAREVNEFLDHSHHYYLHFGDNVLEILAFNNFKLSQVE